MKRSATLLPSVLALTVLSAVLGQNAVAQTEAANEPKPINEEGFVRIGGIEQWITIKGGDRNNPVILFLHGGPGNALSPFADSMFEGWDKQFTLVQWDQRGAGRTYAKNGPLVEPTMTLARMRDDGVEVAGYLTEHLHKKKVIILGLSWGSILGVYMVHARPDLFSSYIGIAQLVDWQQNLAASYARVLELARTAADQQAISTLTAIGPPPWHAIAKWPIFRKLRLAYQAKVTTAQAIKYVINPKYESVEEQAKNDEADDFSFLHFWGLTLSGPLQDVDLPALGTSFAIPVYIIQGSEDLTALPQLAKGYLDSITAPQKKFLLVPGAGHEPSVTTLDVTWKLLEDHVRPIAVDH